jgi:hypothetical protein
MPASAPLSEPEETFARMLASGLAPQQAYTESRIGVAKACTIDQAQRLPGMWGRVQWLKAQPPEVQKAIREPPPEYEIDPKAPKDEQVIGMLIRDHALACAMGQVSAAVRAAELIGKQQGMFIDRSEQKIDIRHAIAVRLDDAIKRVAPRPVLALPSK